MSDLVLKFGTDGVRGVAGEGVLVPDSVERLGQALGEWVGPGEGPVLLGGDTRESRRWITDRLALGLRSAGAPSVDLGVLPTAAMALLMPRYGARAACVISASHNPAEHNGIKVFRADGEKMDDDGARGVERRWAELAASGAEAGSPPVDAAGGPAFLDLLRERVGPLDLSGLHVALDLSHGAAYQVGPELFRSLGAKVSTCGDAPDGANINEGCGSQHPEGLARRVVEWGADLGLAVDGDADRAILVDSRGTVLDGDAVLAVVAQDLHERDALPENRVVGTVMSNFGLELFLRRRGMELVRTPVGDRHISQRMREEGLAIGGEPSGHVIFGGDLGYLGDGLYTALRVVELLRRRGVSLAEAAQELVLLPQVLVGVPVRSRPPLEEISGLSEKLSEAEEKLRGNGRLVIRYSGTEPLLRIMVEGEGAAEVRSIADDLASHVTAELGAGTP